MDDLPAPQDPSTGSFHQPVILDAALFCERSTSLIPWIFHCSKQYIFFLFFHEMKKTAEGRKIPADSTNCMMDVTTNRSHKWTVSLFFHHKLIVMKIGSHGFWKRNWVDFDITDEIFQFSSLHFYCMQLLFSLTFSDAKTVIITCRFRVRWTNTRGSNPLDQIARTDNDNNDSI